MRGLARLMFTLALLSFSGCNRSAESLITRQIAIVDEFGETLGTITDDDSAQQAAPKLARLREEINAMIPRVKELKLEPDDRDELEDQHRKQMEAALEKYSKQLERVQALDLKVGGLSALDGAIAK